jgi:hypothetical protein
VYHYSASLAGNVKKRRYCPPPHTPNVVCDALAAAIGQKQAAGSGLDLTALTYCMLHNSGDATKQTSQENKTKKTGKE